jgi:hypothetical protein
MMAADGVHAAPAATTAPEVTFSIVREADASVDTFGQSTYGDLRADNAPHATPLAPDEIEGLLARILPTIPSLHTGEAAPPLDPARSPEPRGVYCSRALNMRSIQCIGYDMDYTLVQYHVDAWESAAYDYAKQVRARARPGRRGPSAAERAYPAASRSDLTSDIERADCSGPTASGSTSAIVGLRPL